MSLIRLFFHHLFYYTLGNVKSVNCFEEMEKIMDPNIRIMTIRLLERMKQNQNYAEKIQLTDHSGYRRRIQHYDNFNHFFGFSDMDRV